MYLHFIFSKFHFQFENSSTTLPRLSFKSSTANPETFKTKIIDQTKNTTSDIRLSKSDHSMVTSDMFHGLQGEVKTVRNQLSYGIYIHSLIRSFFLLQSGTHLVELNSSMLLFMSIIYVFNFYNLFLFQMLNAFSLNLFCYNSFNKQLIPFFSISDITQNNDEWRMEIENLKNEIALLSKYLCNMHQERPIRIFGVSIKSQGNPEQKNTTSHCSG